MESVRVDKWLWAARFFKTRSLAKEALIGGKVKCDGVALKPSALVKVGQVLSLRRGSGMLEVVIEKLSDKRGGAPVAQTLYSETQESLLQRERAALAQRAAPRFEHKPDKKQRRQIRDMKTVAPNNR